MLREKSHILTNLHRTLDMCLVVVAFISAYYIKKFLLPGPFGGLSTLPNYYLILITSIFICFIVFNAFSLYESKRSTRIINTVLLCVKVVIVSQSIIIFILYFLFHVIAISRIFLFLNAAILLFLLITSKIIIYKSLRFYRARDYNTKNVVIVGTDGMTSDLIQAIQSNPDTGYRILGCLCIHEDGALADSVINEVKIIGSIAHYKSFLMDNTVDELIFATHPLNKVPNIIEVIRFTEELGVNVRILPDFQLHRIMYTPETAKIELRQFLGLPTISISSTPANESGMLIKSLLDYTGAVLGIILLLPLFFVIALLIKIGSPGPIIYKQERCGLYGRRFNVLKFRTMVINADEIKKDLIDQNEMAGPVFKIKDDPRITRIGKLLRKTSFDELPQLFNVLQGHMSLVGPRPPIPEEVEEYQHWQRRRLSMKPGITCIWQVSGRNNIDFDTWMKMDLQYIDTWSLLLDFKIMFLTVKEVLSFNGR